MRGCEYPTQLETSYTFRHFIKHDQGCTTSNVSPPVYIDGNMCLYDKNYAMVTARLPSRFCFDEDDDSNGNVGPFSFDSYQANDIFPLFGLLQFPDYHSFSTRVEFDAAVVQWKKKVEQFTSGVAMPYPILSHTYITSRPCVYPKNAPEMRRYNPITDRPQPQNLDFIHQQLFGEQMELDRPLPQQMPRREVVYGRHQMSDEKQWQSQFIPHEPVQQLYSTFEEYEAAYKNWYRVCIGSIAIPPMRPQQFVDVLQIEKQPKNKVNKFAPRQEKQKQLVDYSWIPEGCKAQCNFSLERIKRKERVSLTLFNDNCIVFNTKKQDYIQEMMKFGVTRSEIENQGISDHMKVIYFPKAPEENARMLKFIRNQKGSEGIDNIIRNLFCPFDQNKISSFFTNTRNKLSISEMKILFEIADYSTPYKYKVASIFQAGLGTNDVEISGYLLDERNLIDLFRFASITSILSKQYKDLCPPPENLSELEMLIYQLHYVSLIMSLPISKFYSRFDTAVIKFCREKSHKLVKMLVEGNIIDDLWKSLRTDKMNDKARLMFILLTLKSDNITRLIMNDSLLIKIVKMSKYELGRKFIYKFILTKGGRETSYLIRDYNLYDQSLIEKLDDTMVATIALCFKEHALFAKKMHFHVQPKKINNFLIESLISYSPKLNPILKDIVMIFINSTIILQNSTYCQQFYYSFSGQICDLASRQKKIPIQTAIELILPCSNNKKSVEEITRSPEFCCDLIQEMKSDSVKNLHNAWMLFNSIINHERKLLLPIIKNPNAERGLQAISVSENPFVFREFANFITKLALDRNKSILDEVEKILSSSIGRMACACKNAEKIFNGYPKTIYSTKNMITSVLSTNGRFMQVLSNHLLSLGVDLSKFTGKRWSNTK